MTDIATDSDVSNDDSTPTPIGVKLGSDRTVVVYRDTDGRRKTVHRRTRHTSSEDTVNSDAPAPTLLGQMAAQQQQEHPSNAEYLLHSGLPADARRAKLTEQFFENLCLEHELPEDSAVVYAIPMVTDECGLANLATIVEQSPVGCAFSRGFPETLCGAIPALGDGVRAVDHQFIALNLGATTLEACAYRRGERLSPVSSPAATGRDVDEAIAEAIADETDGSVSVHSETARRYKETHADFSSFEPFSVTLERPDGRTDEFTVEHGVTGPLDAYLDDVVAELTTRFFARLANEQMTVYQLALTRPLVVTGGMACIPGLATELAARLGDELGRDLTVVTADNPDVAAAEGAYRLAERLVATD
ncbi:hypothetical protein [Haloferax sp. DFSO52]|uniref:hypothetical protein n=1 Tax=Haloferax sp. DFSO52 TaxID=3388505 RepID=UPI003A8472F7